MQIMYDLKRGLRKERGQTLILAAFMLAVVLGFTALTVDVGIAMVEKRNVQNSTDAAALAAAGVLYWGGTTAEAVDEAYEYAEANGYSNDDGFIVEVNIPPVSGPHQGIDDYAEVIVRSQASTHFARLFGVDIWNVEARSVATMGTTQEPYAIIALNPTECTAMEFNGNVTINIANAGIMTNSSCPNNALHVQGSVNVSSGKNHVAGGSQIIGNASVQPAPAQRPAIPDPLGDAPEPTPPAGPAQACPSYGPGSTGTVTLQPGVYDCLIDPTASWNVVFEPGDYHIKGGVMVRGGSTITFNDGIYTLSGIGLDISGNSKIITNNAMLYIEAGGVSMMGTSNSELHAPTSGTYEGITIFQKRDLSTPMHLGGTAVANGWGTIYAAGAEVSLRGTVGSTNIQLIADTVWVPGTSNININFDDGFLADVTFVRLVE